MLHWYHKETIILRERKNTNKTLFKRERDEITIKEEKNITEKI